jgi:hypothetical protein
MCSNTLKVDGFHRPSLQQMDHSSELPASPKKRAQEKRGMHGLLPPSSMLTSYLDAQTK